MGARPSTQFTYPNSIPNIFHPELSIQYEIISSILALDIGQTFNLGYTAPITALETAFPEFVFNQIRYDLYTVTRVAYLGDSNRCCITSEDFFLYMGSYISCPPALKKPKTTRSCDFVLSNYCFDSPTNIPVCKAWFDGYVADRGYDGFTILGYPKCATVEQRNNNKFCEEYLTTMRANPDFTIHDNFIDSIRDSTFRCSFPLNKTKNLSKSTQLPRVCWDRNCITAPLWKLKSTDYLKRLTCPVLFSNVNFTLSDPNTIGSIKVQSDASQLVEFRQVMANQNIYTQALKDVGKGFIDFFTLTAMLGILLIVGWSSE